MAEKEEMVNVTFTLEKSTVEWLDKKVLAEDKNRSQVARKVFREAKSAEKQKAKKEK